MGEKERFQRKRKRDKGGTGALRELFPSNFDAILHSVSFVLKKLMGNMYVRPTKINRIINIGNKEVLFSSL